MSFTYKLVESGLSGVCRNNIYIYVCVNIFFYLKCLWEGIKTPSFAHKIGESGLVEVGMKNIFEYLLFETSLAGREHIEFWTQHWRI